MPVPAPNPPDPAPPQPATNLAPLPRYSVLAPRSGQIGFMVCTKAPAEGAAPDAREPRQPVPATPEGRGYTPLRYYSADVHRAAFVLPAFARDALAGSLTY